MPLDTGDQVLNTWNSVAVRYSAVRADDGDLKAGQITPWSGQLLSGTGGMCVLWGLRPSTWNQVHPDFITEAQRLPSEVPPAAFLKAEETASSMMLFAFVVKNILIDFPKTPWWVCRKLLEHTHR